MIYRLCINTEVTGKASRSEYVALTSRLRRVEWTVDQIAQHLAVEGHPICTADLKDDDRGYARRTTDSFLSSSIVGLDIDNNARPFHAIKDDPFFREHASFAYTTPSHSETNPRYRVIFVLEEPIRNPDEYKQLTTAIAERFGGDMAARDAVRLWFGNKDAQVINWDKALSTSEVERLCADEGKARDEETKFEAFGSRKLTAEEVRKMLRFIPPRQDHIDWKRVVAGVVDALGDGPETLRLLEEWSPSTMPYSDVIKNRLTKVRTGTLIWLAKREGYDPPRDLYKPPTTDAVEVHDRIESYLSARYKFRKNTTTHVVEYRDPDDPKWHRVTDYWVNSMLRNMRAHGLKIGRERIYEILDSEFSPLYDPIAEYFANLTEWRDGDEDHITKAVNLIPCDPSLPEPPVREHNQLVFRKWIVGAVACALDGKPNHLMLILQGAQGVGKTTLLRYLCPQHLQEDHYYEGQLSDDRDTLVAISRSLIIVDDELESLTKKEVEKIKSLVTMGKKQRRLAYDRTDTTLVRRGSFAGSVNRQTFLSDETGSRRFPVITVGGFMDLDKLFAIDVDLIWSQALALYREGYPYWMNSAEIEKLNWMNANYTVSNEADDLVWKYVVEVDDGSDTAMSATSILNAINSRLWNDENVKAPTLTTWQLGRALAKAGYKSKVIRDGEKTLRAYPVRIRTTARADSKAPAAKVHNLRTNHDKDKLGGAGVSF
ncbi:Virulence-associated E [uncultured Caudovirales phage]|uniref:Virulence-associated E n=1 Tax=uncultured Caudovirales phage TaxID=2100421 RepID=A0A6J5M6R4_9CAUD|nr:Virulence-associated E [uncultured Caudovirales phage]